ncbi:MAG: hypothetical protein CO093_09265 [Alphaproteobacteria bacterium CG_4_9_14_3_um_filter_47_13]|nr:MAG: hypothetical protein CO093_09265 [Alphaproteobacteria bacterium CG_4_9_14_3_um_filter_47_13]
MTKETFLSQWTNTDNPAAQSAEISQNIFDDIREGFKIVASLSSHVHIRKDRISSYARTLSKVTLNNVLDDDNHYRGTLENMTAYYLILDCLNFGSGFKLHLAKEGTELKNGSIYFTASTGLKNYIEKNGVPTVQNLININATDIAEIFGCNINGEYSQRFANLCVSSLRDLGTDITQKASGSFLRYVEDMKPSAENMVKRLIEMPGFKDTHQYKGQIIPFYKRAQHNVTVLNLMFNRLGKPLFNDADQVTMFADNAVAALLHADGLLEYSTCLQQKIENREELPSGSEEEIEIRGCEGHVVELLSAETNMKATDIDFILWHNHTETKNSGKAPSHRTLSQFY